MVKTRAMKNTGRLLAGVILACLTACASRSPVPVGEYGEPLDDLLFPPSLISPGQVPKTAPKTSAVAVLLQDARQKTRSGDLEGAAQALERTLRIEPHNPLLWSDLAAVRSLQGQLDQAEQLAVKSNTLAAEDIALQVHNWRLIADVRRQRGDYTAAADAEQKARELR